MSEPITPESLRTRERRLGAGIILGVPIVLVLITFLFWYQTWFGRKLSDSELTQYLADTSVPHKTQHALTQVATEIIRHDPAVERVYPQVVALAGNREPGLRSMAAWVMGQDNKSEIFHRALAKLVDDSEPVVRWNAALGLARFGDAAGAPQLRSMLHPYNVCATTSGVVTFRVNGSEAVRPGTVVARIKDGDSAPAEIRSPLAGILEKRLVDDGAKVAAGAELATISPDDQQIWEALRGLYVVGGPEDLTDVAHFAHPGPEISDRVREQAALTAEAIRKRAADSSGQTNSGDSKDGSVQSDRPGKKAAQEGKKS